MTRLELQERLNYVFYARDFKDGLNAKTWWNQEFKKAKKFETIEQLKEWASWIIDYTYDFDCYYIKEEVEQILTDIIEY